MKQSNILSSSSEKNVIPYTERLFRYHGIAAQVKRFELGYSN